MRSLHAFLHVFLELYMKFGIKPKSTHYHMCQKIFSKHRKKNLVLRLFLQNFQINCDCCVPYFLKTINFIKLFQLKDIYEFCILFCTIQKYGHGPETLLSLVKSELVKDVATQAPSQNSCIRICSFTNLHFFVI